MTEHKEQDNPEGAIKNLLTKALNTKPKKPTEQAGLNVESRFKIFDPVSGKTKVEGRG